MKIKRVASLESVPFTVRCMSTSPCFSDKFLKGDNFCDYLFAIIGNKTFLKKGFAHRGKNILFLREQTLSLSVDLH